MTFKVGTRIVAVSAVVKGKNGEPAGGLSREDFVLKQDGKEEPIRYFSQGSEIPLTLALMVDTSGSQRTFIGDELQASDVFFQTMLGRKEDRAMLVQIDTRVVQLKGLTNSANALHLALTSLNSNPATAGGTVLRDAIYLVSKNILARETGRKAMVILSDGGDLGSRRSVAETIEQAQRADVQIYSILYSMWMPSRMNLNAGFGSLGVNSSNGSDPGMAALQQLSESTGGHVYTVSRTVSLRDVFTHIAEDLRLQYNLGYTPPAETKPNTYHKIELKAKDRKLTVQARKGFFAQP